MDMDFPYARGVVVVRSQRHIKKRGEPSQETRHYLSSLDPGEKSLEAWHQLIRGHWAEVEIRNHWRRDVLFGEDRSRSRNANLLANLALIRTGLLRLASNKFPGQSIPEIKEHLQSHPSRVIAALAA
jgi:predicted transposase YbfD/YdcC